MISIEVKTKNSTKRIELSNGILFNSLLCQNEVLVRKLIKEVHPFYKINKTFFEIINKFVDLNEEGRDIYGGLIVRTGFSDFAVLYLENTAVDDDYIVKIIGEYIRDIGENVERTIIINKMELRLSSLLRIFK